MARHSLFPNSITINYTSNGHAHKQVLPIAAITPAGDSWELTQRDDGLIEWTAAVDAWGLLLADFLPLSASVDSADLFDYEATDAPASFLASHSIALTGTSAFEAVANAQAVMPFKSTGGNSLRLTVMEGIYDPDVRQTFAASTLAEFCAIAEFLLSDDDWIITRGGTFPTSSLGITTKENDKLRKRYFLG